MKKLFFLLFAFSFLLACNEAPTNNAETTTTTEAPTDNGGSQDDPDLVAITNVIHEFYAWYDSFQRDSTRNIIFTDEKKGKHLVLDMPKLDQYLNNLKASGFISDAFIADEKLLWKKCEVLWQKEELGDVPSCVDADRFFCAQDWDMEFWTKAPVSAERLGTDKVNATLSGQEGGVEHTQKFELKKENGKWLITKIECDLGVQ